MPIPICDLTGFVEPCSTERAGAPIPTSLVLASVAFSHADGLHYFRNAASERLRHKIIDVERKVFWITFTALGLFADVVLPLWWALAATIPIIFASWWVAYRSDWF